MQCLQTIAYHHDVIFVMVHRIIPCAIEYEVSLYGYCFHIFTQCVKGHSLIWNTTQSFTPLKMPTSFDTVPQ